MRRPLLRLSVLVVLAVLVVLMLRWAGGPHPASTRETSQNVSQRRTSSSVNPVLEYVRRKGLEKLSQHFAPLGLDGRLDPMDVRLVNLVASLPSSVTSSKNFLEDLDQVTADGGITRDELSFLRDKYANPTALVIEGLKWAPSKVMNEKVYEVTVSFEAEDSCNPIVSAVLTWIPINYENLPSEAFPEEKIRTFNLTPLDGSYGDLREKFSVTVSGFAGGREYEIRVEVRDSAGNTQVKTIRTTYLREYENMARLDSVLIGAHYYPWYGIGRHWDEGYTGKPLLGEYDSRNPVVISKHIDWATGHGIDFFIVSWWGPGSYEDLTLKNHMLENPLAKSMRFAVLYEITGRIGGLSLNEAEKVIEEDFSYLNRTYSRDPRYLRINGKPVVEIYLARTLPRSALKAIHECGRRYGFYLLGDLVYWQSPSETSQVVRYFDGVTSYNMHTSVPGILNNFEKRLREKYSEWYTFLRTKRVDFIPSAIPGFDDRAVRSGNIPLPRSIDRFKEQLRIALSYSWPHKIVIITSFNEWHEYTSIEPSEEYGMKYLEAVRGVCEGTSIRSKK